MKGCRTTQAARAVGWEGQEALHWNESIENLVCKCPEHGSCPQQFQNERRTATQTVDGTGPEQDGVSRRGVMVIPQKNRGYSFCHMVRF